MQSVTERTCTGRWSKHDRERHRIHAVAARAAASVLAVLLQVDALAASTRRFAASAVGRSEGNEGRRSARDAGSLDEVAEELKI
eukprot:2066837-Pleurochrysis_carterae.AAC.1